MTRRRWIADEATADTAALLGEHALHLSRVLRARVGQTFDISVAAGGQPQVMRGTITAISDERVEFALGERVTDIPEEAPQLTLALSIFKFDRFEWALEKCTEIGVARIIPIMAKRSDAHLIAAAPKRHERWLKITNQAAEQSRRASAPDISPPVKLQGLAQLGSSTASRIVLSETLAGSQEHGLTDLLQTSPTSELILAVGPEGGWTEDEIHWFRDAGWIAASLGPTILRAETAAIVASALAMNVLR